VNRAKTDRQRAQAKYDRQKDITLDLPGIVIEGEEMLRY